jgi:hypothetical protein
MKNILIITLYSIIITCCKTNNTENLYTNTIVDYSLDNGIILHGKVKLWEIKEWSYKNGECDKLIYHKKIYFTKDGKQIKVNYYDESGKIKYYDELKYKGEFLIAKYQFKNNDTIEIHENIYDKQNRIIETRYIDKRSARITKNLYNEKGKLIESIERDENGKIIYKVTNTYKKDGLIECLQLSNSYTTNNTYDKKIIIKDSIGNRIRVYELNNDNDTISVTDQTNKENIFITRKISFNNNKTDTIFSYYKNNEHNDLIRYWKSNEKDYLETDEYQYDNFGNIIEKIEHKNYNIDYKTQYKYKYW